MLVEICDFSVNNRFGNPSPNEVFTKCLSLSSAGEKNYSIDFNQIYNKLGPDKRTRKIFLNFEIDPLFSKQNSQNRLLNFFNTAEMIWWRNLGHKLLVGNLKSRF